MPTIVPKAPTVDALAEVWARLDDLLAGLDERSWSAPTPLPGWDVKAVVAHVIGTEAMLLGEPTPDVEIDPAEFQHVRNDIGRFNEAWVASMADASPAERADALPRPAPRARLGGARRDTYQADWDAEGFTPAGQDTYGRFMRIRVFDCWLHEQDIRDAVGRPGGEEGTAAGARARRDGGGARVRRRQEGGGAARIAGHVRADGPRPARSTSRWASGPGRRRATGPATVTLTMPVGVFTRLAGGRADPVVRDQVDIDGDEDLGEPSWTIWLHDLNAAGEGAGAPAVRTGSSILNDAIDDLNAAGEGAGAPVVPNRVFASERRDRRFECGRRSRNRHRGVRRCA